MKTQELAALNFRALLHYSGVPDLGARSSFPTTCTGFCVSCEKEGFLDSGDHRLDQMSHGADTEDFEKSICKLPSGGLDVSVAFLLESPGGYVGNGDKRTYQGVTKQPPVNRYYWTPKRETWPMDPGEVVDLYGDYFAYIIAKHKFHNAYFTNMIKCSLAKRDADQFVGYYVPKDPNNRDSKIRANCYNLFLSEEMRLVNPRIVFYFGQKAGKMGYFMELRSFLPDVHFETLLHPAARMSRSQIIGRNDELILRALSKAGMA